MFVVITNLENGRKFAASFDSRLTAEMWVKNHKHKGTEERILYSPSEIEGFITLGEEKSAMGGITYKLKQPKGYKVEYFDYDINDVDKHWKEFRDYQNKILRDTDYTQLPDIPITTEERRIYRNYREYVRNKENDYRDDTIYTWKILSFDEYKQLKIS